MNPVRIQRKRTKGWKMPPNTVYVGRPSGWGNPYHLQPWCPKDMHCEFCCLTREEAVSKYQNWIDKEYPFAGMLAEWLEPLRGKNLACWCPLDKPCHAQVLLELANSDACRGDLK